MTYLDELSALAYKRVERCKAEKSFKTIALEAENHTNKKGAFCFENSLRSKNGIAFICEVKKASPSKGLISPNFDYISIAKAYQSGGAAAISVLTEPERFLGDDKYLIEIAQIVDIPVLRKDFIVDDYQVYEAKTILADAVLLIAALHSYEKLKERINIAEKLGLSALCEAHTADEVKMCLDAGARLVGVNNRNLKTFEVNIEISSKLRKAVPESVIFVSESGIKTREDVSNLEKAGVNAVLIGETLMRSENILNKLNELINR